MLFTITVFFLTCINVVIIKMSDRYAAVMHVMMPIIFVILHVI